MQSVLRMKKQSFSIHRITVHTNNADVFGLSELGKTK